MATVLLPQPDVRVDERAARRNLRDQVARLERELQDALISGFPHTGVDVALARVRTGGPRVLSLGELERLRDRLSERLSDARGALAARAEHEERSRLLLEEMLRDPARHQTRRIRNADLGEGGCGVWHVAPRMGIIGMLCGWWQVKLSSGCPLAT